MKTKVLLILLAVFSWPLTVLGGDEVKASPLWEIPYDLASGYLPIIDVTIEGYSYRFIFDTGAGGHMACVKESVWERHGFKFAGNNYVNDINGTRHHMKIYTIPSPVIAGREVGNTYAFILPDTAYVLGCLGVDGIIGSQFLHDYCVRIDGANRKIIASREGNIWEAAKNQWGKMKHNKGAAPHFILTVREGSGRKRRIKTLFDTGSASSRMALPVDYFSGSAVDDMQFAYGISSAGVFGFGQNRVQYVGTLNELTVGGTRFTDFPVTSGKKFNLGAKLLEYGDVILDFPRSRFCFLPMVEEPTWISTPVSPIGIIIGDGRMFVASVWDESLYGVIYAGDRIVSINGYEIDDMDECTMQSWSSFIEPLSLAPDSPVRILSQDGTEHTFPADTIIPAWIKNKKDD